MDALPIPVHPWPMSLERLELLKAAKASLNSEIKIIPVESAPGSPGRVLCFGEMPPDYPADGLAPIAPQNVDKVDSIAAALAFWLNPWSDSRQYAAEFWLGAVMGCEVRYSHDEDDTGKRVWT